MKGKLGYSRQLPKMSVKKTEKGYKPPTSRVSNSQLVHLSFCFAVLHISEYY